MIYGLEVKRLGQQLTPSIKLLFSNRGDGRQGFGCFIGRFMGINSLHFIGLISENLTSNSIIRYSYLIKCPTSSHE